MNLLNALWRSPDQIHQIGSLDRQTKKFTNTPVKGVSEALSLAQALSDAGVDAYFACSEYATPDSRTAANVSGAFAFWVDIDCGNTKADKGKGYRTEADALVVVEQFCQKAALPSPTHIVSSGGGLHAYWVLDRVLGREIWQAYAGKLKALTKVLGFLADDSRTSDIASVLRVPGTLNFKYVPPRLVTLLQANDAYIQQAVMFASIEKAFNQLCGATVIQLRAPSPKITLAKINDDADTSSYGPPDLSRLASALAVLDPDCDERTWKLARIAPLARAANTFPDISEALYELAKSWSSGELGGVASKAWGAPGASNGRTGEQEFDSVWQRFLADNYTGTETTLGTVYHAAREAGWISTASADAGNTEKQFQKCKTVVVHPVQKLLQAEVLPRESANLSIQPVGGEQAAKPAPTSSAKSESGPALSPLATIQQRYCLINMDGKLWVLDGALLAARNEKGTAQKLVLSSRPDGCILIQRAAAAQFPAADVGTIYNSFVYSPQTICYDGVEFNPCGTTGNYLNLWVGPTITPKAGAWPLIQAYLFDVICDGVQKSYDYLIRYIAHALQQPGEKPGVMIILLGGQGTGKGTLGRVLRMIWSATYLQISNIDNVTGNFNAALERAYIVFMDEALFSGNRRASDVLKSLVTEETVYINEKFQPTRQTQSYHRFIAATNADHFKNTERDDRRDFTLRVSEAHKGDHGYWRVLNREIKNGGVEAMVHDLQALDLTEFNIREKPDTKELLAQKLQSLGPIECWWYDCLDAGASAEGGWPKFLRTDSAIESIVKLNGGKLYRNPTPHDFVQKMLKLCPSAVKKQQQDHHSRHRGLALPGLQQARTEFEQYIGGAVNWDSDAANGAA